MSVQINNFSMAYTSAGQGAPVLFIHGYPLNRQMWQPQVDGLAAKARILAPDLRGHGDSQAVPGPYTMDLFASDLKVFLDTLDITQRVVVCGLSMGGYVAFAFYRKYAARIVGLILTATRAAPDSQEGKIGRDQAAGTAQENGVDAIVEAMLPKLVSPKTLERKPEVVAKVRAIMQHTSLEGVLGDLAGLRDRPDSTPTLGQIKIPTLILHGADDAIVPLKEAQAMQAGIAHARLEVIPDAGHLLNLEDPKTFNQAVGKFIQEL